MKVNKCSVVKRERERWYGLPGVAMGTQLVKAGRVSVEEKLCAAGTMGCLLEAALRTTQTSLRPSPSQSLCFKLKINLRFLQCIFI